MLFVILVSYPNNGLPVKHQHRSLKNASILQGNCDGFAAAVLAGTNTGVTASAAVAAAGCIAAVAICKI